MREYSPSETLIANLPYAGMLLLGAITIAASYAFSAWALLCAGGYLVYGILGALWIMIFVCPYCGYYATRTCPCGYGMVAARIAARGDRTCFAEKFRRHIPVIVPLWIVPVACGGLALRHSFSGWLAGLIAAFVVESWVILPLASKQHGCADCPQKDACPWMGSGRRPSRACDAA
jgi:hypothetical protein